MEYVSRNIKIIYNLNWMEYVLTFLYKKSKTKTIGNCSNGGSSPLRPHASSHSAVDTVAELLPGLFFPTGHPKPEHSGSGKPDRFDWLPVETDQIQI